MLATTAVKLADRHTDQLAFGWRRRADRLANPGLDFADLVAYDDRIHASLTALVHLGEPARQHLRGLLNEPVRSAALFAVTCYALATQDAELFEAVSALTTAIPDLIPAKVAALQWAPDSVLLTSAIDSLSMAQQIKLVGLRYRAWSDLDERLLACLQTQDCDAERISAALQLIRDLGRADLAHLGRRYLDDDQPTVRLAAAQTLLTLGSPEHQGPACDALQALAMCEQDATATAALRVLALHVPACTEPVLARLASMPQHRRRHLLALGWLGRADAIADLIVALEDRHHGRAAAAALALITGSDPGRDGWSGAKPERRRPPAEPGDQLSAHPDDHELPWPDPSAFAAWWSKHSERFTADQRYFAGRPLTPAWLATVLRTGPLPWRPLAAEHRQRLVHAPLFPTELPADVQRQRLHELN
ncbi:hypothetical protein RB25_24740 [Herbaspirillum rubrisubalbicans]|uniref:TIGR02270 family protein n=1 Tax=Herbaspirillum rubrisubalbicans TaxID=80842 RepID=A0ABX9BV20_9BURK|nr:hypothetical protein RB24_24800 [Herbaspirillum rubrisubalbicans]RAN43002.1 hypothetical protein RB25_24740 [Herbaspirillum rubrisubalbicans]